MQGHLYTFYFLISSSKAMKQTMQQIRGEKNTFYSTIKTSSKKIVSENHDFFKRAISCEIFLKTILFKLFNSKWFKLFITTYIFFVIFKINFKSILIYTPVYWGNSWTVIFLKVISV
jgi:hypothetical protein